REILARATTLPVREAADTMKVQKDHVYVIPPNTVMTFAHGTLDIKPRVESGGTPFMPIDHLFRSLAHDQKSAAVGVILSGNGTDGTLGLEEIKAEGGITFAQHDTAKFLSMPRSAAAQGCVDFILPPDAIARQLTRISNHPYATQASKAHDL